MQYSKKIDKKINKYEVEMICIDDFAIKKRHNYATVMIDIKTRKIIDMIKSHDYEDVKQWLATFPNLKIISRDGSISFNKSIRDSYLNTLQVSDRFHILKNLTDYCKEYINIKFNKKIMLEKKIIESKDKHIINNKQAFDTKWELICETKILKSINFKVETYSR